MKQKNTYKCLLALLAAFGIMLAGCTTENSTDEEKQIGVEPSEQETDISLALVTDTSGVEGQAINEITWFGIKEFAEENNLKEGNDGFVFLQSETPNDYYANLNGFVARGFDLIFGAGVQMEVQLEKVAEEHPQAKLVVIDEVIEADNIANMMFQDQEGAFLAGVVAALKTEKKKVGFIGGLEIAVNERFESGFRAGIRDVNPDVQIEVTYLGSSTDVTAGKEAAYEMYASGVDIIFQVAGEAGKGVFAEAKERKAAKQGEDVWVIGSIVDQYDEGVINDTSVTLVSVIKNYNVGVRDIATQTMRGKFPGGRVLSYGIQQGAFSISDSREVLSKDVIDQINIWRNEIIAGTVNCWP